MQLKQYRESIGMTRSEMARQLQIDVVTAWRWENGFIIPSVDSMRRVSRWSGGIVTPNDWVREDVRSGGEA